MYVYDNYDERLVRQRVAQFRDQVARRLKGELDEEQFKPLRLMNGLYLQLHAYMLRVAIPYGTLNSPQMRKLADIARRYDRGYGHWTTRQNIQFNWISLEQMPDILDELADVQMHAIQTSGNCIRNVTTDQFAGAAADEIEDPRVWCEVLRQWSTLHPEFSFLPRKFKIAVTGSPNDRAAVKVHDIGLRMHKNGDGETGFEVLVGGGLGRTPMIGKTVREFLPREHLLSYMEAVLRVYNRLGRRDNLFKARIKILVHETGVGEFTRQVEDEWRRIKDGALTLPRAEIDRLTALFAPPEFEEFDGDAPEYLDKLKSDPSFAVWARTNVVAHKQPGYAIALLSLKPTGSPPGDTSADQLDAVADLAETYSFGEIRATHGQNLVFAHVRQADLADLWAALREINLATPNIGLVSDVICCPGLDYCALASARSIPVAQAISAKFESLARIHDIGPLEIKMSGCINACGHHHVGHIGILGVDKKGEEFYQVTLGGAADQNAELGRIIGPAFAENEVAGVVETIVETYLELRENGERFIDTYRRVGMDPFKDPVYGAH